MPTKARAGRPAASPSEPAGRSGIGVAPVGARTADRGLSAHARPTTASPTPTVIRPAVAAGTPLTSTTMSVTSSDAAHHGGRQQRAAPRRPGPAPGRLQPAGPPRCAGRAPRPGTATAPRSSRRPGPTGPAATRRPPCLPRPRARNPRSPSQPTRVTWIHHGPPSARTTPRRRAPTREVGWSRTNAPAAAPAGCRGGVGQGKDGARQQGGRQRTQRGAVNQQPPTSTPYASPVMAIGSHSRPAAAFLS